MSVKFRHGASLDRRAAPRAPCADKAQSKGKIFSNTLDIGIGGTGTYQYISCMKH